MANHNYKNNVPWGTAMTDATHYETAPEDRIPLVLKITYGFGAFVNNILAAAIGGMVIVLNLGLGMNPALVGLLGALPRLTDAFVPCIASGVAIWAIASYTLTEEKAHEVRMQLEARRGSA